MLISSAQHFFFVSSLDVTDGCTPTETRETNHQAGLKGSQTLTQLA